jgi:hypothetical protein
MRKAMRKNKCNVNMFFVGLTLVSCAGAAFSTEHSTLNASQSATDAQALLARVTSLPASFLDIISSEGNPDHPTSHTLTPEEREMVRQSLTELAPLQQRVMLQHLASISFADGMPNSALTYPAKGRPGFFNITIRAGVLHETVSQLVTKKENACFTHEDPGSRVVVDAGQMPALTYILLHESTHVVDASIGLTADTAKRNGLDKPIGEFGQGVWVEWKKPVQAYDSSALQVGCYHHGGKDVDISAAPAVYQALATTPFPSLYATASEHEYIAELMAYSALSQRFHQPYTITVYLHNVPVYKLDPMKGALVRAQMPKTHIFYGALNDSAALAGKAL